MAVYSNAPSSQRYIAWQEGVYYFAVIFLLLLLIIAIQILNPVAYVYLISEDNIGEYATSVAFAISGGFFIASAVRRSRLNRALLLALGLMSILVAGEEISWGQRIFGIDTPEVLRSVNRQGEITLHNIGALQGADFHEVAGILLQVLMLASAFKARLAKRLKWIETLPLPPLSLWPASLVVSFVLMTQPMVKGDEISEAFLAFIVLMWSFLIIHDLKATRWTGVRHELSLTVVLAGSIAAGGVLSATFGKNMGWRYNITAVRDYPEAGMMEQSKILFLHILPRPDLIQSDTLENYRRLHQRDAH